VPSNGRWIGSARSSCSSALNVRSRERGSSCGARRTGCFPTRHSFTKSFMKAGSADFGISFAGKEAVGRALTFLSPVREWIAAQIPDLTRTAPPELIEGRKRATGEFFGGSARVLACRLRRLVEDISFRVAKLESCVRRGRRTPHPGWVCSPIVSTRLK
jgi:hypothetical protein